MFALAEHVAETLDIGPGTRVFEVDCGAGEFLAAFHQNNYIVGGIDGDPDAIAAAAAAMPDGSFHVGLAPSLDPAVAWHVVLWRIRHRPGDVSAVSSAQVDYMRGVLARMFAKATHAIGLLDVPDARREWMMHVLAEIGASAIQFETSADDPQSFNVFARV
jgi:hypothetical protein